MPLLLKCCHVCLWLNVNNVAIMPPPIQPCQAGSHVLGVCWELHVLGGVRVCPAIHAPACTTASDITTPFCCAPFTHKTLLPTALSRHCGTSTTSIATNSSSSGSDSGNCGRPSPPRHPGCGHQKAAPHGVPPHVGASSNGWQKQEPAAGGRPMQHILPPQLQQEPAPSPRRVP